MEENQTSPLGTRERQGFGHAWLIGGIAVLALILAWVAFNRAGQDVLPTAAEEAAEAQQAVEASAEEAEAVAAEIATNSRIAAARIEARTELLALQAELEAGAAYEDVQDDINRIEANLEAAYANTSDELQSQYGDIKQNLDSLADSIQNGTGDALQMLANLSLMLEAEVRNGE